MTRTVEDLRDEMETRVAGVVASPLLAAKIADRNAGRQRRRQVVGVAVLAAAVAAVVIPIASWPDDQATIGPSVDGLPVPEGWTAELPGVDLPLGEAVSAPYMTAGELVIDGHPVEVDPPLDVHWFLTVPGGAVVTRGTVPGHEYPFATSLDLIRADGSVEVLDSGFIAGSTAGVRPDGTVVVVYGWMADPDSDSSEIRILELGSGQAPQVINTTPAMGIEPYTNANSAGLGQVMVQPISTAGDEEEALAGHEIAILDLETEQMTPADFDTNSSPIGFTPGGLDLRLDLEGRCVTAYSSPSDEAWSLCGDQEYTGSLSPDRATYVTHGGSYDAETGELIASFPLPDGYETGLDSYGYGAAGWEDNDTVVFPMVTGDRTGDEGWYTDGYVPVRCEIATGSCERIPHPVGMLGQLAQ